MTSETLRKRLAVRQARRTLVGVVAALSMAIAGQIAADGASAEKRAAAAQAVLARHCASCHGAKAPGQHAPFEITGLDRLSADRRHVVAGLADASRLFTSMASRAMPPRDGNQGGSKDFPTGEEIASVRAWINGLAAHSPSKAPSGSGTVAGRVASREDSGLQLSVDGAGARAGEIVSVRVQSSRPCALTLINVEPDGIATVLFPNDFQRDSWLGANEVVKVPPDDAPFRLRFDAPGRELLAAICSTSRSPVDGIRHDFERMRFTVLGDWERYLKENLGQQAVDRRIAEERQSLRRRVVRRGRARRRGRVIMRKPQLTDTQPAAQVRTAVTIDVLP